jgi:hypothetical protein
MVYLTMVHEACAREIQLYSCNISRFLLYYFSYSLKSVIMELCTFSGVLITGRGVSNGKMVSRI